MHQKFLALSAATLGLCTFALSGFAQAASPSPTPVPPVTPLPGSPGTAIAPATPGTPGTPTTPPTRTRRAGRGHHPAIRMAINSLERAKADMLAASHDFGGHRTEAVAACDAAIAQLREALQYANETPAGTTPPPATP